jgi:hypothetical protein
MQLKPRSFAAAFVRTVVERDICKMVGNAVSVHDLSQVRRASNGLHFFLLSIIICLYNKYGTAILDEMETEGRTTQRLYFTFSRCFIQKFVVALHPLHDHKLGAF